VATEPADIAAQRAAFRKAVDLRQGEPATEVRLRAALSGSSILPSDTSVRYVSLVGMVFATTIVIYLRLWLDHVDSDQQYQVCAEGLSRVAPAFLLPGSSLDAAAPFVAMFIRCGKPYATTALTWAVVGVLAVAVVAAVAYLVMPWWRIRRRGLRPLDRVGCAELHAHLDGLVERMGLPSRPTFWVAPRSSAQGVAFGRQTRCHVQLNAGLVKRWYTDRPVATAVVLHELAHIRNRDIRYTYLAITTWWAFVLVALFPYVLTRVLPLVVGGYPGWWPAWLEASSANGRVAVSVLAMTALAYLMYTAILRVREVHADTTAAVVAADLDAGHAALRRVLDRSSPEQTSNGFWNSSRAVLRKHPSTKRRLAILDDPTPLYSARALEMVGTGIAVAVVQSNLYNLASQLAIAITPAGRSGVSIIGYLAVSSVAYGVSIMLIAAVACVTMWRTRLRTYPGSPHRMSWLWPAAAFAAGLLIGEPLSVFFGAANVWGVFDGVGLGGAGVAGAVGAVMSAAALVFGLAVLFAWMSECAAVWIQATRGWLWRVGLVACLVGALAFGPAYMSWSWTHDTPFILDTLSAFDQPPSWVSSWQPPGEPLVYGEYLPLFLVCRVPGVGVLLALPWLFVIVGAARRPPSQTPRWLRSVGPIAAGTRAPRQRIPIGAAMWIGLAGASVCLLGALGLAILIWYRTGGRTGPDAESVANYLLFATPMLAVAFSAISASAIAARTVQARGTLAVLAASVTSGVVAIATPLVAGVGVCGPIDVLARAGCHRFVGSITPTGYGLAMLLGVPRAVIAACLAAAVTAALSRMARGTRVATDAAGYSAADAPPSTFRRTALVVLVAAIIANLAVGGYVGYSQFLA
jgi:Zn-dependent protease with chaperone function